MIIYNVTVNIQKSIEQEWLEWMQNYHIPDVLATGHFHSNRLAKLLEPTPEDPHSVTYLVQYHAKSFQDLQDYRANHAPRLQHEHTQKFQNQFVAFRTVFEYLNSVADEKP